MRALVSSVISMKGQAGHKMEVHEKVQYSSTVHPICFLSMQSQGCSSVAVHKAAGATQGAEEGGPSERKCALCKQTVLSRLKELPLKELPSTLQEPCCLRL